MSRILLQPARIGWSVVAFFVVFLFVSANAFAATYDVRSADDVAELIESNRLAAGDEIVWQNGQFADQELDLHGVDGDPLNPITFRAEVPGKVILHGESQFKIGVNYWVIRGFHFAGKSGEVNAYNTLQFRSNSGVNAAHCRLTDCAFTNLVAGESTSKWVLLFGAKNVIDHCHFSGKNSKGALLTIELGDLGDDANAEHRIEQNYFGDFLPQAGNDNETIRVGYSGDQYKSAKCLVRENLFLRCNGENEIVSNKASYNVYESNTFRRCSGALVLRHGHHARVTGNFFLGEGVSGAGGIRVSDSHHVIENNHLQDLMGAEWNAAFSIVGGKKASGGTSNGYQAVENIVVTHNSILSCRQSIFMNVQKGKKAPTGLFANNLVSSRYGPLISGKLSTDGLQWMKNILHGSSVAAQSGESIDPVLRDSDGILRPSPNGPAVDAAISLEQSPRFDIDGQPRPKFGKDIGADELVDDKTPKRNRPLKPSDVGVQFLSQAEFSPSEK